LLQQWLKQMTVEAIDERDLERPSSERFRGSKSAESCSDDDYPRGIACHEECLPDGAVLPRDLASMPVWKFAGVLFHFTSI
jgi:hypothetical protein